MAASPMFAKLTFWTEYSRCRNSSCTNCSSTSEALARALPMALIEPIPGQEERNADHLLEAGAAIRCNNLPAAAWKIAGLLGDPDRLGRMREAARAMGKPGAAEAIAEDALRLVD